MSLTFGCWYKKKKTKKLIQKKKILRNFLKNFIKLVTGILILIKEIKTIAIIKSFQRHYLPKNVSGVK